MADSGAPTRSTEVQTCRQVSLKCPIFDMDTIEEPGMFVKCHMLILSSASLAFDHEISI